MQELRNCPECDRLFVYTGRNLCPRCAEKAEEEFMLVKEYIRKHPGATVIEVADATGVEEAKILDWLKEGRLISKGLAKAALFYCERCGTRIAEGRFCRRCLEELNREVVQTVQSLKGEPRTTETKAQLRGRDRMFIKEKEAGLDTDGDD